MAIDENTFKFAMFLQTVVNLILILALIAVATHKRTKDQPPQG